jgi:recombination protein RecR
MALYLLQSRRQAGLELAEALAQAMQKVRQCASCRNLTEQETCRVCRDGARDASVICVVESPADILAIEQAGGFKGVYYVLHGRLSPLDGVGPEELGMQGLFARVKALSPAELIIATNPTVEGEATALYLARLLKPLGVRVTRIAMGIPVGSDLEYTDEVTMTRAMENRRDL